MGKPKLSPQMTVSEFESGYWYALELKAFAKRLGIPAASKLRKDEIEKAVKTYLRTGKSKLPTKRKLTQSEAKDSDLGLSAKRKVRRYTNNKETKDWLVAQAKKIDPSFKERSGARMRLNRWREEQMANANAITYGDLAKHFVHLNKPNTAFKRERSTYYIYFLSDYLKNEEGTRKQAITEWHKLKKLKIPNSYAAWKKHRESRS